MNSSLNPEFQIDFTKALNLRLPAKKSEFCKSLGLHLGYKTVVDATCGLGQDAILMARLGLQVTAIERSPVVFKALQSAWANLVEASQELQNLNFMFGDSIEQLPLLQKAPDVIYLDPMFVVLQRSSKPKKHMQQLSQIVGADADQDHLLEVARAHAQKRVVVKRKVRSPKSQYPLPDHSYRGQKIRYDIYLCTS